MIQTKKLTDSGVNINTPIYFGQKSIWFDGTYYWIAYMEAVTYTMYVYRYNSDLSNATLMHNKLNSSDVGCSPPIIIVSGTDYYFYFPFYYISGSNRRPRIYRFYFNGLTWTENTYGPDNGDIGPEFMDVFWIGAEQYASMQASATSIDGHANKLLIYKLSDSTEFADVAGVYSKGMVISSVYHYLQYVAGGPTYKVQIFDGATISTESTITGMSGGSDLNGFYGQYTEVGSLIMIGWVNNLWFYPSATRGWVQVSSASSSYPSPGWYLDGTTLKLRGWIYGSKYLTINNAGMVVTTTLSSALTTYCSWDTVIIDRSQNAWFFDIAEDLNILRVNIDPLIEREAEIHIFSKTVFSEDQAIQIYNTADVLQCQGNIANDEDLTDGSNIGSYQARIIPFIHWDLELKIDYTSSAAETVATAMAAIITANFKYGSAGTLTSSATTYVFNIRAKPIREIFTELAHLDGKIWYCSADDKIYLDNGAVDSNTDIKNTDGYYCGSLKKRSNNVKIGTVELWGRDGSYIKAQSGTSNGYISDVFPALNQDQIASLATQYLSTNGTKVTEYQAEQITGIALFQIGKQITFEQNYAPFSVTSAQYYTKSMKFILTQDQYIISQLVLHDVLHYQTNQQITTEKVESHIQYVEEKVDNLAGGNYIFFLNNAASAVVATYKQLTYTNDASANEVSATITASGQVIEEWITENAVGVTILNKGQYEIHAQYKQGTVTGYKTGQVYWDLYKRTSGGTETLLGTSQTSNNLTSSYAHQDLYVFLSDDVAILSTDRLVIKLRANISGSGSNPVVYITYGGTTYFSHLSFNGILTGVFAPLNSPTFTGTPKSAHGIADDQILVVDDAAALTGEFPLFTANGIAAKTLAEIQSALSVETTLTDADTKIAGSGGVVDLIKAALGIGSANSRFVQMALNGCENTFSVMGVTNGRTYNTDATEVNYSYQMVKERTITLLGTTYNLHLASLKLVVGDADANHYVDAVTLTSWDQNTGSDIVNDSTNRTAGGDYDYAFADVDVSAKDLIGARIITQNADATVKLRITALLVEYYYDT